jgi:major intracellular serine protease
MNIPTYQIQDVGAQAPVGVPWDLVKAPLFWPHTKGGGVVVAIIDTGLDINHPEFEGRVICPQCFVGSSISDVTDVEGHGTHVAGIIAGKSCGIAPEARIMPIKVFGDNNVGSHIYGALLYILNYNKMAPDADKVRVVNCSFSGGFYDIMMAYAIRRLTESGVSVVVSAGNAGDGKADTEEVFSFPAYIYECITVGATNLDGLIAGYSNSFDGIDIAAPGTDIHSAWPGGGYKLLSGTSMSAPHVTGALALINDAWRIREGRWPNDDEAYKVLIKHTQNGRGLNKNFVGEGVLDLTWDNKRWPLWRVQLDAFYFKEGMETLRKKAAAANFNTYPVKY